MAQLAPCVQIHKTVMYLIGNVHIADRLRVWNGERAMGEKEGTNNGSEQCFLSSSLGPHFD